MSDRLLVATRKGLFSLERKRAGCTPDLIGFVGNPVTNVLRQDDGVMFAALKLGHFGPKLHRSDDDGRTWRGIEAPAFAADTPGEPSLFQIWSLEGGGPHHPNRLWIGAIPAGLFRSDDRGDSWQLMTALWNVPERARWFGGGYDDAGIHSISPDPRDPGRTFVAISCGGVWETRDDGATWNVLGKGLVAPYGAPRRPMSCGCSTPPAFIAPPMPARTGRGCRCPATISVLRSPPIRTMRKPRGLCRRSRTRSACRATARYV